MESPVEIRYAGVVIGRAQEVRSADADSKSFFLAVREPMPVGSVLHLRTGDRETPARVVHAVESSDPAACGMQVCLIGEGDQVATEWIPPPAATAEKARPAEEPVKTAMAVIEVGPPGPAPSSGLITVEPPRPPAAAPEASAPAAPAALAISSDAPAVSVEQAAPVSARKTGKPAVEPAVATAAEPPPVAAASSGDAIPEAVPVAVGSSMTGALENAAAGASVEASVEASAAATDTAAGEQPTSDELPPARPIAGPSGRRKTKRRR
jgi:hypothetical protein